MTWLLPAYLVTLVVGLWSVLGYVAWTIIRDEVQTAPPDLEQSTPHVDGSGGGSDHERPPRS